MIVEAVKQQLDGDGIIVRVYECFGRRTDGVQLRLGYAPEQAEIVNLLEETIAPADLDGQTITFDMKPYEIKTFLLK